MKTLKKEPVKKVSEAGTLSMLLNEIEDKSLQMILRRVIFKGENVLVVLAEERPETRKN